MGIQEAKIYIWREGLENIRTRSDGQYIGADFP